MQKFGNIVLIGIALAFLAQDAAAERFEIVPGNGSEVVFESKAPMDSFKGRTRSVHGWFDADLDDLSGPVSMEIVVELATFDTGKNKRNQHMRDNHLETETYPQTVFRAGTVNAIRSEGETIFFDLLGELDLHGVVQPRQFEIILVRRSDGSVTIDTRFVVKLSEHDIKRPKFLVMKLADEQKVHVQLEARPGNGGGQDD